MKIRLFCCLLLAASTLCLSQGPVLAQEFTRSTIPLKSGGSITSIQSQGRNASYLNRADTRTADARSVPRWQSESNRQETGFAQSNNSSGSSSSFYRTQQADGDDARYPYPAAASGSSRSQGSAGFGSSSFSNASASSASSASARSNAANNGQATLRFDRSGLGERPSGALGDNGSANGAPATRVAQLPQPPTQLPQPQLPAQPAFQQPRALPNPAAAVPTVPTFGVAGAGQCNCGPNYANPAANYAAGYQGYQAQPQAANTVPALNLRNPQAVCACNTNCCVQQQQQQQQQPRFANAGFQGFQGYQFQPNIGQAQFGASNNPWWSSFLTGSGQYTPLLQFRNMPPGTYLGQGLIGQPTAYVDGQPIRNLFRYIAP